MSGTELARKMAVVFTERLKTELMTCEDVVATGRYPYTGHFGILTKKDREAVREAMELVHVMGNPGSGFCKNQRRAEAEGHACKSDLSGTGDCYFR